MKIVIIDNYDSFTYNLSHLVKELGAEVTVYRNDQFEMSQLETFDKIILSPGPGIPSEAGLLLDVIKTYAGKKPILGVCLLLLRQGRQPHPPQLQNPGIQILPLQQIGRAHV